METLPIHIFDDMITPYIDMDIYEKSLMRKFSSRYFSEYLLYIKRNITYLVQNPRAWEVAVINEDIDLMEALLRQLSNGVIHYSYEDEGIINICTLSRWQDLREIGVSTQSILTMIFDNGSVDIYDLLLSTEISRNNFIDLMTKDPFYLDMGISLANDDYEVLSDTILPSIMKDHSIIVISTAMEYGEDTLLVTMDILLDNNIYINRDIIDILLDNIDKEDNMYSILSNYPLVK